MTQREQLVEAIVEAQRTILRELNTAAVPEWLMLELSMAQLKGLLALHMAGPLAVGGLVDVLGISLPTASILADRLVQSGLAERYEDRADRRRTIVGLTPQGEQLITRLRHGGSEVLHCWLDQLDDDEIAALARGMRPLAEAARRLRDSRHAELTET